MQKQRRKLLKLGSVALLAPSLESIAAALRTTPSQSEGPFYPASIPLDADADLIRVQGQSRLASGIICHLTGKILDLNGCPIINAKIEIWQCDAFGAYHHRRDRGDIAEPEFQGYGYTQTGSEGGYRFRTITPTSYPGRTPHIHVKVSQPGMESLTTQLYIEGEPQNQHDFLFNAIAISKRPDVLASFPKSDAESITVIPEFNIVVGHTTAC